MPEGRLIKRKITDNYRLLSQPIPARHLYYNLILWVDKEGRIQADIHWINKRFFQMDNYADEEVEEWLQGLHDAKKNGKGLIELYEVDGLKYMWLPGFLGEQSLTWFHGARNREAESSIPAPTKEGRKPPLQKTEQSEPIILTPFEIELLETMKTIPGWVYDEAEDTAWIRSLSEDFTNVTIDNLKACRDYHSDKPTDKGPWKNRIRNWLKHDLTYSKEGKSGKDRKNPRQLRPRDTYTEPES